MSDVRNPLDAPAAGRLRSRGAALLFGALALLCCTPVDGDSEAPDALSEGPGGPGFETGPTPDVVLEPSGDDGVEDDRPWPPELEEETDTFTVGPEGGSFDLLGGEVLLDVPPGSFPQTTDVQVGRKLVDLHGETVVGYIWGPHGTPVDPPANLTVRAPVEYVPAGAEHEGSLGLFLVLDPGTGRGRDPDGDGLAPLGHGSASLEGATVVLEGEMDSLGTIVIFAP